MSPQVRTPFGEQTIDVFSRIVDVPISTSHAWRKSKSKKGGKAQSQAPRGTPGPTAHPPTRLTTRKDETDAHAAWLMPPRRQRESPGASCPRTTRMPTPRQHSARRRMPPQRCTTPRSSRSAPSGTSTNSRYDIKTHVFQLQISRKISAVELLGALARPRGGRGRRRGRW